MTLGGRGQNPRRPKSSPSALHLTLFRIKCALSRQHCGINEGYGYKMLFVFIAKKATTTAAARRQQRKKQARRFLGGGPVEPRWTKTTDTSQFHSVL